MLVVTYSEARQNFSSILDKSKNDGAVLVKRADDSSPFAGIKTLFDLKHDDIMQSLKETREEN